MKQNKSKVIYSPQLTQYLLQAGYIIIDVKPKRGAPKETVFVFKVEDGFFDAIETWKEDEA